MSSLATIEISLTKNSTSKTNNGTISITSPVDRLSSSAVSYVYDAVAIAAGPDAPYLILSFLSAFIFLLQQ